MCVSQRALQYLLDVANDGHSIQVGEESDRRSEESLWVKSGGTEGVVERTRWWEKKGLRKGA